MSRRDWQHMVGDMLAGKNPSEATVYDLVAAYSLISWALTQLESQSALQTFSAQNGAEMVDYLSALE
jgi:hypothetical protein